MPQRYLAGLARLTKCFCCCRYEQLLALVHSVNGASLLVGGPGTAKTTVINQFLSKFNSEVRNSTPAPVQWCLLANTADVTRGMRQLVAHLCCCMCKRLYTM